MHLVFRIWFNNKIMVCKTNYRISRTTLQVLSASLLYLYKNKRRQLCEFHVSLVDVASGMKCPTNRFYRFGDKANEKRAVLCQKGHYQISAPGRNTKDCSCCLPNGAERVSIRQLRKQGDTLHVLLVLFSQFSLLLRRMFHSLYRQHLLYSEE